MSSKKGITEKFTVAGANLVDTVKTVLMDPSVERITVRSKDDQELLRVPVVWGAAGFGAALILAPILTAVAGIGGAVAEVRLEVERRSPENS